MVTQAELGPNLVVSIGCQEELGYRGLAVDGSFVPSAIAHFFTLMRTGGLVEVMDTPKAVLDDTYDPHFEVIVDAANDGVSVIGTVYPNPTRAARQSSPAEAGDTVGDSEGPSELVRADLWTPRGATVDSLMLGSGQHSDEKLTIIDARKDVGVLIQILSKGIEFRRAS